MTKIGNIKPAGVGKFRLRLSFTVDGVRRQPSKVVSCRSEREAEKLLIEFYNEESKKAKQGISSAAPSLGFLWDEFYKNHVVFLEENTKAFYNGLWKNHLERFEKTKVKNITPSVATSLYKDIPEGRTKQAVFKFLKAMFSKAFSWGLIEYNIFDRLEAPKYKAEKKEILSPEDIQNISFCINKEQLKYQCIYYFALLLGLRRQEIGALKWTDIDFKNNRVFVSRAAVDVLGDGTQIKDTKTHTSTRVLDLPNTLLVLLRQLYTEQLSHIRKVGDKWHGSGWVFTTWDGDIMNLSTVSKWWKKFLKKNDIDSSVTFHGLRHTSASYMIRGGAPVSTVSAVLGHSNITTTLNIYSHEVADTRAKALGDLETNIKNIEHCS